MKNILVILGSYLKRHVVTIIMLLISLGIYLTVFSLYSLPLESVVYASVLTGIFVLLTGIVSFINFYRKHIILDKLKHGVAISDIMLPAAKDLIEKDYQEIIKEVDKAREEIINAKDQAYIEMMEYYTIWAHQIKTPIAAMQLILQSEKSSLNNELLEQLFRIEQYVEMVLQYLRLENMGGDLLIKSYPLDDIVKQAIRKYSKTFILKKIKLNYKSLNCNILTDEKWLVFVVEQILSNALKYTNSGEISIYMDDKLPLTLVIEDTGIGIEEEDLPRVFEKGFTGYTGRLDKKSTGIGLYLCKRILTKLSHTISIESKVGKGTKVKIGLDTVDIAAE